MASTIRVGIVGCGKIASVEHVPAFTAMRGVQLVAMCDLDERRAADLGRAHGLGAEVFADYRDMLRAGVDAVVVATPNDLHAPITIEAFRQGAHVLCEKPIAGTLADATRMIAAGQEAGRVLQINQSLRYAPLYQTIASLIHRGRIGEPRHVRCLRAGGKTPDLGWSPGATWFVSKARQGGLVLDIGVHMADALQWFFGDVSSVGALLQSHRPDIDVPDHFGALFRFANGATGVLEVSWALPSGGSELEVYGSRGRLRVVKGEKPIEWVRPSGVTKVPVARKARSSQACFIDAVRGRKPSPTPGELGREALSLCVAIERSGGRRRFESVRHYNEGG